ncbi:MAG: biotin/lipoyl-binding protein, partial [Bacteroidales bacterium]|nr:biotin/lipoyl-binding protein [Bacteroidales bacterium]
MDRKIEKKKGLNLAFTKKALPYWLGALLLIFILWLVFRDDSKKLRIDADNISINTVSLGQFNDYIRISGQVAPITTIQISPLEGGVVQEIVTEEGSKVKKGDVILILSNESLDMQILNSEADLAEKENILRNTLIQMEQQKLSVEQEKLQLQMEVQRNRRTYEAQKSLYDDGLIAREDYLKAEDDFTLSNSR